MSRLTALEARALDAVDRDGLAASLTELLAVPSVTGSDAESDVQHLLGKQLTALGLDVDLWPLDLPALASPAGFPGTEAARTEAWGLVGTAHGEGDRPAMVLQGHVDVVPPGDLGQWRSDPFEATWRGDRG